MSVEYPVERERRWLVRSFDAKALAFQRRCHITQGYFDVLGERSFRVRILRERQRERAVITLKEGMGEIRTEREEPIEIRAAHIMLDATAYRIQKRRSFIHGWELDVFEGPLKGIVLLEYEAKVGEIIPELPPWIHDAIDVTDSLTNLHLARMSKEIEGDAEGGVARFLEPKLPKIVLTGGPCSGKSTLMREIAEKYGNQVHCVPEVATILISQVGVLPSTDLVKFQKILYRIQRSFEEAAELQAIKDGKKAIVLDRGTLDALAYMPSVRAYEEAVGTSVLRDECSRYKYVLFLASPPQDVFESYARNNPARFESYAQAIELADKTHEAWRLVERYCDDAWLSVVDGASWQEKREAALGLIANALSYP